jgi:MFS family permease
MKTSTSHTNWSQIYALAALNAAVVISWIAYHNYQPKLLEKFEYTNLANFLSMAQALVLICVPPLAGFVADAVLRKGGNQFLVFTVGIGVTAMTFMAVAFSISGTLAALKTALPLMIVVWLISMNIFHSPANSMLELFTPAHHLPTAMAVIAFTTELLYGLEPIVVYIVDFLGAVPTFVVGGVLLVLTSYWFKQSTTQVTLERSAENIAREDNFVKVILAGLAVGAIDTLVTNQMTTIWGSRFDVMLGFPKEYLLSAVLVVAACCTLPLSRVLNTENLQKALVVAVVGSLLVMLLMYTVPSPIFTLIIALPLAVFYSILLVTALPYSLQNLSARNVTLGTGIFFGSFKIFEGILAFI